MRISIFCSTGYLNVFAHAIWFTKIQQLFNWKHSAAQSSGTLGYLHDTRLAWRRCHVDVFSSFLLCHAVPCCAVERRAVCCVVLCRDVSGLCNPEGLIEADAETGIVTALMKSVSADCTQGQQLGSLCRCSIYRCTGEGNRGWDIRGHGADTEMERDLAESLCLCVWVCVYVCLSNYTLMYKALCCAAGVPHSSGFNQRSRQPQTPCLDGLGLNRILMWTGVRESEE